MDVKKGYLLFYNALQFAGWAAVLVQLAPLFMNNRLDRAYAASGSTVGG